MSLEIGSIVDGKVTKIMPFGALILLESGETGLVHISHISHGFVDDINEFVEVDDEVEVKILDIDAETGRITLSIKETEAAPVTLQSKEEFEEKFKDWVRSSTDRISHINRRNKRR
ncbi:MAG: S1 RNA-binding domain-containing protein [Defluviitaleaceae bacterium]|nr:S1 RNA-binding domain-containing protein [Defluviitaleaceae bacterium]